MKNWFKNAKWWIIRTWNYWSGKQANKDMLQTVKRHFRWFFEGNECFDPIIPIQIHNLMITNFEVEKTSNVINITITLERPGILIGKGGITIDSLKKYLENQIQIPVTIKIKESRMWH